MAVAEDGVVDLLHRLIDLDAERLRKLRHRLRHATGAVDPARKLVALADHLAHHVAERDVGGGEHGLGQRAAERAVRRVRGLEHHVEADLLQHPRFGGLVEHLEAGRDVGLEREQVQQLGAEGVDGVDLQAARRLQRQREKLPRPAALLGVNALRAGFAHGFVERDVIEHGPCPQRVEHAVRHVGGGGLGEGDAEDAAGIDAGEQQPDHALRQHVGLAGAGVGGDPGRALRVRRVELPVGDGIGDDALFARAAHRRVVLKLTLGPLRSFSSSPISDHSCTRARWS